MRSKAMHRGISLVMLLALALSFAWVLSLSSDDSQPIPTGYATSEQPIFSCPVKGSDNFGSTACYMSKKYRKIYHWDHTGIDLANGRCGSPVRAMGDGTATFKTGQGGYGTLVTIQYSNGWTSRYAHMQDFAGFSTGTHKIKKADVVGHVGGECSNCVEDWACHLHYELYNPDGKRVDPWEDSCWDMSIKPGWEDWCTRAQMRNYNPSAAAPELDSPDVPGLPVSEVGPPGIVPLAARLEPNTYSFNPSFRVELDYTLDEYETLFDFARKVATCQEDQPKGVNPCVRGLMGAESAFVLKTGTCAEDMTMPHVGFGTYEFCALSPSAFPLAGEATTLESYVVGYNFALVLEDNTPPPAVSGLEVTESPQPGWYKVSWNSPAEDIDSYHLSSPSYTERVDGTRVTIPLSRGEVVTVTPKDYAGHNGPSKNLTVS